jgi:hypothetical protein
LIPVISILIPTRNRPSYLTSLFSIVERCRDSRIQFLVSDNSDAPLDSVPLMKNVIFYRPERVLSMTDHWNFLSQKATGKYLAFMGDDDAFIPSALLDLCNLLEKDNSDIVWTPTAGYGWPTMDNEGHFFHRSYLKEPLVNLQDARLRILNMDYSPIPIPYNNTLFKRQIMLDFLQDNPTERFFSSRIPDVNAGVKILFLAKSQMKFDQLTFISGSSSISNGLLTRSNLNHPRTLEFNDPQFNPLSNRKETSIRRVSPFGFITYFEAIEESLLQLGMPILCRSERLAFRSIFESSFPKEQLAISLEIWPNHRFILKFAYILTRPTRASVIDTCLKLARRFYLVLQTLMRRERVISIYGPGLPDTTSLVDFLEKFPLHNHHKYFLRVRLSNENHSS